jgi:hypothetical protein
MMSFRISAVSIFWAALSSLCASDLSHYREFQLDANLTAVVKQAGMQPADAKVVHERPALIQELSWRPPRSLGSSVDADSVKEVQFAFYNGDLFRVVVNYDRYKTEGLTAKDLIEGISGTYGTAMYPIARLVLPSSYDDTDTKTLKVIARWEDSKYSFNLVHSSDTASFALVVISKRLDAVAAAAVVEAVRLDKQEAPQREIERQNREEEQNRVQQERAREVNRPGFRP